MDRHPCLCPRGLVRLFPHLEQGNVLSSLQSIFFRLSDQLRNYQTLSIGDEVVLFYDGNDYLLHVMQVKPHAPEQGQHTETNQTGK